MKITAAVASSGFSNVKDSVFFCLPDCRRGLSRFLEGHQVDWVDLELPDNVAIDGPDYGRPEQFTDEKNPNAIIRAYTNRKYDPPKGKWIQKIYIDCFCGFETVWTHTVEY